MVRTGLMFRNTALPERRNTDTRKIFLRRSFMKKRFCCIAAVAALFFVFTACGKSGQYNDFRNICVAKLSDGKYPSAAELEAASKDIESWNADIKTKAKDIIVKAKAYEAASKGTSIEASMKSMADYGSALGAFIDATN
jgi:hypothetical protein